MQPDARIARHYLAFDKVMQSIRDNQKSKITKGISGYSAKSLAECLSQRVALAIFQPYMDGITRADCAPGVMILSGLMVDTGTGTVNIKAKKVFSLMFRFYLVWILALLAILIPAMSRKKVRSSLVYGVPAEYISDELKDYCLHSPIDELNRSDRLFIQQIGKPGRIGDRIYLHRLPLVSAVLKSPLGLYSAIAAIVVHLYVLLAFTLRTAVMPVTSLLWQDFALHSHAYILNKNKLLDAVVFTNSNMMQQFLWMNWLPRREFRTLMALYSLNSHYFVLKDDPVYSVNPAMRMVNADEILVWNDEYGTYLENEGLDITPRVVFPVVWQNYRESVEENSSDEIVIGVFDVSPLSLDYQRKHGLEGFYYSKEVMTAFIDGVIEAAESLQKKTGKNVRIRLKHKRALTTLHDESYFRYIDACVDKHENFQIIPSDSNIFDFVSSCNILTVIPYSSPVYIGARLNIPSIYFDPTENLLPTHMEMNNVTFAAGKEKLLDVFVESLIH
jgi:hypothetical protein